MVKVVAFVSHSHFEVPVSQVATWCGLFYGFEPHQTQRNWPGVEKNARKWGMAPGFQISACSGFLFLLTLFSCLREAREEVSNLLGLALRDGHVHALAYEGRTRQRQPSGLHTTLTVDASADFPSGPTGETQEYHPLRSPGRK